MAVFLQPIYTQTVGAGGVASITFNNIPQTYTDLKIVASTRSDYVGTTIQGGIRINGDSTSDYSYTFLEGTGALTGSNRSSTNYIACLESAASLSTSNTFGSNEIYIPNYTSSNYKSVIADIVAENNGTTTDMYIVAGLWRSTSAITSINLLPGSSANFTQYTTASLYGILRQGI